MPSGLQSDGRWLCKPCEEFFATHEALLDHKRQMRQAGNPRHIHCKHCGQDFKTERAELFHLHTFHPQKQNLKCVACGQGPFARVSALIAHIEEGQCTKLDSSVIDQRRETNMEFSRKLEELTKEPIKNNFTKYICPAPVPSAKVPEVTIFDSMDPDHPDHPSFMPARYHCRYADGYICPKIPCGKVFPKAGGLISHLRSTAHGNRTYLCPYCLKKFKSLRAIIAHAESNGVRCRIRESDNYDAFMHQLTAGIVDVGTERFDDGTIKYETATEW